MKKIKITKKIIGDSPLYTSPHWIMAHSWAINKDKYDIQLSKEASKIETHTKEDLFIYEHFPHPDIGKTRCWRTDLLLTKKLNGKQRLLRFFDLYTRIAGAVFIDETLVKCFDLKELYLWETGECTDARNVEETTLLVMPALYSEDIAFCTRLNRLKLITARI